MDIFKKGDKVIYNSVSENIEQNGKEFVVQQVKYFKDDNIYLYTLVDSPQTILPFPASGEELKLCID